jgi:(p)ppGpp synthase/HD superfamily hydrolase
MASLLVNFMEIMDSFLEQTKSFARRAHEGQVRKYTGEPYVEHVLAVGLMYQTYAESVDTNALYAAILHDTVEDCDVTIEEIQSKFGDKVAEYVWYLTKPESFVGDRAQRKALDRARLALAPSVVRFIKTLDIMHNAKSIKKEDPQMWSTWRIEMRDLLDAMNARSGWLENVHPSAFNMYDNFYAELIAGL